jgi:hypothetical protein
MLLDDVFAWCGRQVLENIHPGSAIDQRRPVGDRRIKIVVKPHIAAVASMDMCCINDANALFAASPKRLGQPRDHGRGLGRSQLRALGDEIVLHIHHHHNSPGRINDIALVGHAPTPLVQGGC